MKKIFVFLLCLTLTVSISYADQTDYASMTTEELTKELNIIRNELLKQTIIADGETILLDQNGITVYLTRNHEIISFGEEFLIDFEAVVVNNTDKEITVDPYASINGWDVKRYRSITASSGHKCKEIFEYNLSDASISSYEEINDIEFRFEIYDSDYKRIEGLQPVTIMFNKEAQ